MATTVNNVKTKALSQDRADYRDLRAHALAEARALLTADHHELTAARKERPTS
ncbi:hypothetical protein [Streptomyces montanus]|uniref:hypothetical protein n=1 Tax=Streptomyces montanus TaxID=2580423 RepID=UPI0014865E6F|nr:hypothetical protein [Streptomyces montanus]